MSALKDSPCDGVVAFGGIDWWYHNRGHSECQVMTRLASEMPVLWINSIGMRAPAPGKTELPWRRYMRKLKSTLKGLRRDPESGMWIYSPIFVPRYTDGWLRVNGVLLGLQITLLRWLLVLLVLSLSVSAGMVALAPEINRYAGFSGVLHGLFLLGLLPQARAGDGIAAACLLYLVGKILVESFSGPLFADPERVGAAIAHQAHLAGVLGASGLLGIEALRRHLWRS